MNQRRPFDPTDHHPETRVERLTEAQLLHGICSEALCSWPIGGWCVTCRAKLCLDHLHDHRNQHARQALTPLESAAAVTWRRPGRIVMHDDTQYECEPLIDDELAAELHAECWPEGEPDDSDELAAHLREMPRLTSICVDCDAEGATHYCARADCSERHQPLCAECLSIHDELHADVPGLAVRAGLLRLVLADGIKVTDDDADDLATRRGE